LTNLLSQLLHTSIFVRSSAILADSDSFEVLEPKYDGFRDFNHTIDTGSTESLLVDEALHLLADVYSVGEANHRSSQTSLMLG
jgi:hypothetical protein